MEQPDFILKRRLKTNLMLWWGSIDHISFIIILTLMMVGLLLIASASTAMSFRISTNEFHFVQKQALYIPIVLMLLILFSVLQKTTLIRICSVGIAITFILLICVLFTGTETKGARRWLSIMGISIQPSEFLKPFYGVCIAKILEGQQWTNKFLMCFICHAIVCTMLILQPDFGMVIMLSFVTGIQLFVAGLHMAVILTLLGCFSIVGYMAYLFLPHVYKRIDDFLNAGGNSYQVQKSLESYSNGGLYGTGPGEGNIKYQLPDSHADFIFAVGGEEFGGIFCILVVFMLCFISTRAMLKILNFRNSFNIYMAIPPIMYLSFQSIFNIGVTLNIFPTKGMTLPFLSYGGSSLLASGIAFGIYLNATRSEKQLILRREKMYVSI